MTEFVKAAASLGWPGALVGCTLIAAIAWIVVTLIKTE